MDNPETQLKGKNSQMSIIVADHNGYMQGTHYYSRIISTCQCCVDRGISKHDMMNSIKFKIKEILSSEDGWVRIDYLDRFPTAMPFRNGTLTK